jgi:hypothetical protein
MGYLVSPLIAKNRGLEFAVLGVRSYFVFARILLSCISLAFFVSLFQFPHLLFGRLCLAAVAKGSKRQTEDDG